MRAFLCHSSKDSKFVILVAQYLKRNLKDGVFYYEEKNVPEDFVRTLNMELERCNCMIIFIGDTELSGFQTMEISYATRKLGERNGYKVLIVRLPGIKKLPKEFNLIGGYDRREISDTSSAEAYKTAEWIIRKRLGLFWSSEDDLPLKPNLFSYEKNIIKHFIDKIHLENKISKGLELDNEEQKRFEEIKNLTLDGCPIKWMTVEQWEPTIENNDELQNTIGSFREPNRRVVARALSRYQKNEESKDIVREDRAVKERLFFPEAGPRKKLYFITPGHTLKIAILVSGGIAPGINAVIDGIVKRHKIYAQENGHCLYIIGLKNGFQAFEDLDESSIVLAHENFPPNNIVPVEINTSEYANEGGSIIGTARVDELIEDEDRIEELKKIVSQLRDKRVDILYIIGGDGSMKAAHALYSICKNECEENPTWNRLSVVAIPKTMDNDILWMWQSFGFISAVEKAREVVEHLYTEIKSNPRLCVVQLFGSASGFVVSHAVLASREGGCDVALIPEEKFSMRKLVEYMKNRMIREGRTIPYGLIVMSETAIPEDAEDFIEGRPNYVTNVGLTEDESGAIEEYINCGRSFQGQTNDFLRNAGLKIVKEGLKHMLSKEYDEYIGSGNNIRWESLRVVSNEPRHILRATRPSTLDIINGNRLGSLAVDNAMGGYTDFMISQWLTEFVLVPLKLVVLGRKRIPKTGIFWKSVIAKTGQSNLV